MMDIVEEDAESLLELKEGEEEDDAVVKSITKADVEELLGGSLDEDEEEESVCEESGVKCVEEVEEGLEKKGELEEVVKCDSVEKSPCCTNTSHLPSLIERSSIPEGVGRGPPFVSNGPGRGRFPPHRGPLMRFFPPHRLPPPFHFRGGPPPHPHFMRPPMRPPPHPLLRHEHRFIAPHPRSPYNSVSKALSIARIVVQKKLKAEAEEAKAKASEPTSDSPPSTPTKQPGIQPLIPLKRPLQEPPKPTNPPVPLIRGGPGQVHSNLRRIQTVDEPPPTKRYSVSDQLKAVSIAHKPAPTLTRINIEPGPPPNNENNQIKKGTRIKISNLPASATFEKMCSMTTACGSVKTINILGEDNSAVIEFMDTQIVQKEAVKVKAQIFKFTKKNKYKEDQNLVAAMVSGKDEEKCDHLKRHRAIFLNFVDNLLDPYSFTDPQCVYNNVFERPDNLRRELSGESPIVNLEIEGRAASLSESSFISQVQLSRVSTSLRELLSFGDSACATSERGFEYFILPQIIAGVPKFRSLNRNQRD
ncbi:unnamed protein product [Lepeophtheirus salmonis]|uniref:(salmon louse) hypothetical protein n=1 Tax=Lepeophtheirus salmonis TaxID=72036 RepID=A0A7R8CXG9_LEPSM|nr:unnamed protein product [Lepeophtheirus salmonis]CAF2959979.1 unnamed protein product [Lepeophtheirus salmonis]